jgi:hypothetical protein
MEIKRVTEIGDKSGVYILGFWGFLGEQLYFVIS